MELISAWHMTLALPPRVDQYAEWESFVGSVRAAAAAASQT